MASSAHVTSPEPVTVPSAAEMSDETFFKHYNARHLADVDIATPIHFHKTVSAGMVRTYRAYHDRCHRLGSPTDHVHQEDE